MQTIPNAFHLCLLEHPTITKAHTGRISLPCFYLFSQFCQPMRSQRHFHLLNTTMSSSDRVQVEAPSRELQVYQLFPRYVSANPNKVPT
jgi:hypothetical protein